MGEDDDRRRVRFVLDIVGEPGELVGPKPSKAAGLEVDHVDEGNEVNAVIVEAVPTRALGALAVTGEIGLAQALVDDVMLTGNVVHIELGLTKRAERIRIGRFIEADMAVANMRKGES